MLIILGVVYKTVNLEIIPVSFSLKLTTTIKKITIGVVQGKLKYIHILFIIIVSV